MYEGDSDGYHAGNESGPSHFAGQIERDRQQFGNVDDQELASSEAFSEEDATLSPYDTSSDSDADSPTSEFVAAAIAHQLYRDLAADMAWLNR